VHLEYNVIFSPFFVKWIDIVYVHGVPLKLQQARMGSPWNSSGGYLRLSGPFDGPADTGRMYGGMRIILVAR